MTAFIKMKEMLSIASISRSSLYSKITEGSPHYDPGFPKPIRMAGDGSKKPMLRWARAEVDAWLAGMGASMPKRTDAERELERIRDDVLRVERFFEHEKPITAREELRDLARSIRDYRKHFSA